METKDKEMEQKIKNWIKEILKIEGDFVLAHPKDIKNGDYTFVSSSKNSEEDLEKEGIEELSEKSKRLYAGGIHDHGSCRIVAQPRSL